MKCLEQSCDKEIQSKTGRRKFCSDKCKMKHFRKHGKKDVATKFDVQSMINEFKAMVQDFAGKINYGQVPTILDAPKNNKPIHDEPLSFAKMQEQAELPSFQYLLNGMANIHFSDDKESYAEKIRDAVHLSEKQRNLLLTNLWAKN